MLARELEASLERGHFEEALRLRRLTQETYGPSPELSALAFLEALGPDLWEQPASEALSAWVELDEHLRSRPALRHRVRDGVFARLLSRHTPDDLATVRPACLPALTAVLASRTDASPEEPRSQARRLVRDALIAGRHLPPLEFEGDEALKDLLAEELSPRWLACLGAIRRLWPAPPASEDDLTAFQHEPPDPVTDDEAALAFWLCLRVASKPGRAEALLHEARRRMKRLRPDFHALFMRRVP